MKVFIVMSSTHHRHRRRYPVGVFSRTRSSHRRRQRRRRRASRRHLEHHHRHNSSSIASSSSSFEQSTAQHSYDTQKVIKLYLFFWVSGTLQKNLLLLFHKKEDRKKNLNYRVCNKDSLNFFWWRDITKKRDKEDHPHFFIEGGGREMQRHRHFLSRVVIGLCHQIYYY